MPRPSRRQRLALVVLVLVSVTVLTLDFRTNDGEGLAGLRTGVTAAFGTVQRAVGAVAAPVLGRVRGLDGPRVRALEQQNAELERRLQEAALDNARAEQLDRLTELSARGGYTVVPGRVVALGPTGGFEWTATIDLGSRDGVRAGMTVVNGAGLVGRVTTVAAYTARVLLAVDPVSAVGSRLAGSGELGITRGDGLGPLRLQLLDPQAPLRVGDRLVTGPYGQTTYAPGIPIGRVSTVTGSAGALVRTAEVTPYADFTALDTVGVVVVPPRTDPRDRVLHPASAASTP